MLNTTRTRLLAKTPHFLSISIGNLLRLTLGEIIGIFFLLLLFNVNNIIINIMHNT